MITKQLMPIEMMDPTGTYCYSTTFIWDDLKPRMTMMLLHPVDGDQDFTETTFRRAVHFASVWDHGHYGSLELVYLFSYRTRSSHCLALVDDPVGPKHLDYLNKSISRSDLLILAWGESGKWMGWEKFFKREEDILRVLSDRHYYCLGLTKDNHPMHPFFIRPDTVLCEIQASVKKRNGKIILNRILV